jgi:hypothetical protein
LASCEDDGDDNSDGAGDNDDDDNNDNNNDDNDNDDNINNNDDDDNNDDVNINDVNYVDNNNLPPCIGKRNDGCTEMKAEEEETGADSVVIRTTIKQITGRGGW